MSIRRHTTCAFLVMLSGLSLGCKPEGEAEYPYGVEPRAMTHASGRVVNAQEGKATGGGEPQAALTDDLKHAKKFEVGDLVASSASTESPNPASQSEGSAEIAPLDSKKRNPGGSASAPPPIVAPTKWREEWLRASVNGSTFRFLFRNDGTFKRLKEEEGKLAARWVGIYEQKEGALSLLYSATAIKPGSKESVQHGVTKTLSFEFEKGKGLLLNGDAFVLEENGKGDSNDG